MSKFQQVQVPEGTCGRSAEVSSGRKFSRFQQVQVPEGTCGTSLGSHWETKLF